MSDYLQHHGILGQKWGVRRYQQEDGTLTSAGKARYTQVSDTKYVRSDSRDMTDEQLNTSIKRLSSEKAYNDLSEKTTPSIQKKAAETAITAGIGFVGGVAATYAREWISKGEIPKGKDFAKKALSVGAFTSIMTTITKLGVNVGKTPTANNDQNNG